MSYAIHVNRRANYGHRLLRFYNNYYDVNTKQRGEAVYTHIYTYYN